MTQFELKVPDIGDFKNVAIIELLVKPGDMVAVEQSLITVESDKASMEIPSTHAGKVKSLSVKLGDTVNEGSVILVLEAEGAASESKPAPALAQQAPAATQSAAPAAPAAGGGGLVAVLEGLVLFASPGGWKRAAEQLQQMPDEHVRRVGGIVLILGLVALWLVR